MRTIKRLLLVLVPLVVVGYFIFHKTRVVDPRDVVVGEIVVDFKDEVNEEDVMELGKKYGIKFHKVSSYSDVDKMYVGMYEGDDEESVIDDLRDEGVVEAVDKEVMYSIPEKNFLSEGISGDSIEADVSSKKFKTPNDPLYKSKQWNMRQANVNKAWQGKAGDGIIVAVLDTGVDESLEDLADTKFVKGYNFANNNSNTTDKHGHGSHCSGTIAQSTNNGKGVVGVAYKATIMPIKVLGDQGGGSTAGIAQGIRWATDHGAKVISMSLGGGGSDAVMANAIKYAHEKGVFVVAAMGNSKTERPSYPAAYPYVCAVAALGPNDKTAHYSNWGDHTCISAGGGAGTKDVNESVWQNTIQDGKPGYYGFSGTSMATPLIAGVAAMIMSEGVSNPDEVRKILTTTARVPNGMDSGSSEFKKHYGSGIVDADKAVAVAQGNSSSLWFKFFVLVVCVGVFVWLISRRK